MPDKPPPPPPDPNPTNWLHCAACGNNTRKHRVLFEKKNLTLSDPEDGPPEDVITHRFAQCMGCESYKYAITTCDWEEGPETVGVTVVYPDAPSNTTRKTARITVYDTLDNTGKMLIPDKVWKMYRETIDAINGGIRTLAGGGLRATVEAICLDKGLTQRSSLQDKIDELARRGFLTSAQVELLHEERYLGNAALHELETPSNNELNDGMDIVEGLMNTIYILPSKAERLKEGREKKKQPSPPTLPPAPPPSAVKGS